MLSLPTQIVDFLEGWPCLKSQIITAEVHLS